MQQVRGRVSSPRRSARGPGRAAPKRFLAGFLSLRAARSRSRKGAVRRGRFAALWNWLFRGGLRRAALIVCAAFYGLTGLYAAALNGAFERSTDLAADTLRTVAAFAPLGISEIEISGAKSARRDEVLVALGVSPGQSILWLDTHAARARIESLPWVERATVLRLLPDTVKVSIEERRPYAIWQRGGALSVIDEQGRIIADASRDDYAALPLVVGHGANEEARSLFATLERWPSLFARMRAAVRVADRRWNIRLLNGIDIRLPENGVEAAIDELAALDEAYGLLQRDIAGIDLRLSDRFTIRLTDEAAIRRDAAIKARGKGRAGADT